MTDPLAALVLAGVYCACALCLVAAILARLRALAEEVRDARLAGLSDGLFKLSLGAAVVVAGFVFAVALGLARLEGMS